MEEAAGRELVDYFGNYDGQQHCEQDLVVTADQIRLIHLVFEKSNFSFQYENPKKVG